MCSLRLANQVTTFTAFANVTFGVNSAVSLVFSIAFLIVGSPIGARGQSALDGLDPNANEIVDVAIVQPDGKILLGGSFTTLSPNGGVTVTRNGIARLNPNGTLDTAFDPNA